MPCLKQLSILCAPVIDSSCPKLLFDRLIVPAAKRAERWSYMRNCSEAELEQTDLVLVPLIESSEEPDASVDSWQLPCHSIILSSHSPVFSASKRFASCMKTQKNAEGKRLMKIPLAKDAAEIMLQYCYGVISDIGQLTADYAVELARFSNMTAMQGKFYLLRDNA